MGQRYIFKTKRKSYFFFDKWMTSLEMRAFGWRPKKQTQQTADGKETAPKPKVFTFLEFRRVSPYTNSYFFAFVEALMYFVSWFRRTFIFLNWLAAIILIVCGILGAGGGLVLGMDVCLFIGLALLLLSYVPSALLCLFGWAYRKIFKVEEKLKDNLEKNGYEREQPI